MAYRLLVVVLALLLVGFIFLCFWLGSAAFLKKSGETDNVAERARLMAMWTFMGFGVGLLFVGIGGPVLGTYAFYRAASQEVDVSFGRAIGWGAAIVVPTSVVAAALLTVTVFSQ